MDKDCTHAISLTLKRCNLLLLPTFYVRCKDWKYLPIKKIGLSTIFLQDYGIKHVISSKGQYKILKMVSSDFLIMLLEQTRRNIALLLLA